MKSIILLILISITSCGKPINDYVERSGNTIPRKTHPDFYRFIEKFNKDFNVKSLTPIIYSSDVDKFAGACFVWNSGYKEIQISKILWNDYSITQREILIYHELGHCEFNLDHDDLRSIIDLCPESLMRSYMFSKYEAISCYEPKRLYYIEDMELKRIEERMI